MDLSRLRSFMSDSGLDVWTLIDMSISVACADHGDELKNRRDSIVEKLYKPPFSSRCENCDHHGFDGAMCEEKQNSDRTSDRDDDDENENVELKKILDIKYLLDEPNQSGEYLIELLQSLVGMDITFKALKDTDIGRHVTRLRKHSSNEVRKLVKILIRKWKDTVDEWVRLNTNPFEGYKDSPNEAHLTKSYGTDQKDEVYDHANAANASASHYGISKEKVNGKRVKSSSDFASSLRRLDHDHYQEPPNAKKRRTMDFQGAAASTGNGVLAKNGRSIPLKYW